MVTSKVEKEREKRNCLRFAELRMRKARVGLLCMIGRAEQNKQMGLQGRRYGRNSVTGSHSDAYRL